MATRIQPIAEPAPAEPWSIDAARALYNVEGWGAGYFDINERGHVVVRPDPSRPQHALDLRDLAADLEGQGIQLPILLRFSDILRSRIETLSERFAQAIKEFEYTGGYTTTINFTNSRMKKTTPNDGDAYIATATVTNGTAMSLGWQVQALERDTWPDADDMNTIAGTLAFTCTNGAGSPALNSVSVPLGNAQISVGVKATW